MAREAVLLDRWRAGDVGAFDELVRDVLPTIERLAKQLTGDQDVADDVVANALIRAYKAGENFNGGAQFKTWMHRIVVNCVHDEQRRSRLATVRLDELYDEDDGSRTQMQLADGEPSALDLLLAEEQTLHIQDTIARLQADQQNLLLLFHEQGLGYAAISEVKHAPVGTIKSRLHRARQTIAHTIELEGNRQDRMPPWPRRKAS